MIAFIGLTNEPPMKLRHFLIGMIFGIIPFLVGQYYAKQDTPERHPRVSYTKNAAGAMPKLVISWRMVDNEEDTMCQYFTEKTGISVQVTTESIYWEGPADRVSLDVIPLDVLAVSGFNKCGAGGLEYPLSW